MELRWITAFVDQPAHRFDAGVRFWSSVTGSLLSPARGSHEEFATLLPPTGDPYLRVQRTDDGSGGVHLDLHVDDLVSAGRHAQELGARLVDDHGHMVMSSPVGAMFCFVAHEGERVVPDADTLQPPHRVDQICLDIPAADFEREATFWADLIGWKRVSSSRPEFEFLDGPSSLPLGVLLQRLADDGETPAHAHLDLACGEQRERVAEHHLALGAERVGTWSRWITMRDPAGLLYCLTGRDPAPVTPPTVGS